ncbi:MAG: glycoside hydrolase family 9 protein [Chitinophagaceae bacterium]
MKRFLFLPVLLLFTLHVLAVNDPQQWIRINLLGYQPGSSKVAVWCSKKQQSIKGFQLVNVASGKIAFNAKVGIAYGAYGPFAQTCRLDFSAFKQPGKYVLKAGNAVSPEFSIDAKVYNGTADFCLQYMRQQRSGFNPYLKDSCHTHDGYTLYGPMPDSTHIDVSGGWHDASDYLQYVTTSANATYHLLAAYRDFPQVFGDEKQGNGLDGKNGRADVLDEARWGLDWLLKMHPKEDWLFNQLGDDRDHMGMRIPKEDSFYGKGFERPVYFCSGQPQVRGKFMNATTGVASTAGKFTSAFALGAELFNKTDASYSGKLIEKAASAFKLALQQPGVCQTASVRSPYIYAEDNWVDDMELALAALNNYNHSTASGKRFLLANGHPSDNRDIPFVAMEYANRETVTPWLGTDTANHYQWYPFINLGHYELARRLTGRQRDTLINYYRQGIERVWSKANQNAFFRGIPFIWCSNNLTASFAIQCYWYRQLTKDTKYIQLEQACFDWLFGCNPWGSGFVYGLPAWGNTPVDPHSAFTHLKNYPINGGLVDGPVYGNIYSKLIGITLYEPDEYAAFQSDLVVYHDDYGDYSTNEPTMDGTASLIYLLAAKDAEQSSTGKKNFTYSHGAVIRGDTTQKQVALVFTGDEFADGGEFITETLRRYNTKASFFFTGRFYRNPAFSATIRKLQKQGNYLGPHSDNHLLYCDWNKRDSLLVTKQQFDDDLAQNYKTMQGYGITQKQARFFLPPYEWYNDSITAWTKSKGLQLVNFTPGTRSNADYTTPDMSNYRSSENIIQSVIDFEEKMPSGLNGFLLLMHIGTDSKRTDKLYNSLPHILTTLQEKGYRFVTIDKLLQ